MAKRLARRVPVHGSDGKIVFLDLAEVFYLEADGEDTLVRVHGRRPYRSRQRLSAFEAILPPPFFRCHRTFIVNVDRVRSLERPAGERDYQLRLEPPVNTLIPLARGRHAGFRRLMGIET